MAVLPRNVPLSTQIAEQLRERIASGEFPVGSRLPTELELTAQLGVSRNSVREATRSLVHSGLLVSRAGDGTYVQADSELATAQRRRVGRSRNDDVAEVRSLLDRTCARLAAERARKKDLRSIRDALDARAASTSAAEYVEHDVRFHRAIAMATGNTLLAELYRGLDDIQAHVVRVTPTDRTQFAAYVKATRQLTETHERLFAAIEAGDADRAERLAGKLVKESHALPVAAKTKAAS
jgi:DNA-binding FadR family transcriptional regulator